jgi:Cytosolic carboxypeptidase N-terminal domain
MSAGNSISISDTFDGGNIECVESAPDDKGKYRVLLRFKQDVFTELEEMHHCQYFCFRSMLNDLEPGESKEVTFVIENASEVSFPVAWKGSTIFYT